MMSPQITEKYFCKGPSGIFISFTSDLLRSTEEKRGSEVLPRQRTAANRRRIYLQRS